MNIKVAMGLVSALLLVLIAFGLRFNKIPESVIPDRIVSDFRDKTQSRSPEEIFIRTYPNVVLEQLWLAYSDKIQKDGRTIDRSLNYLTTSEGQSYSMLRAVWMDDKATFDRVWKWTINNLQKRPDDELFAWKWGQNPDGRWDVLVGEGGMNSASDADQDIALALIFASKRWNNNDYMEEALVILNDIWEHEVLEIDGKYYMLAGNWAKGEQYPTVNPSYLSPASYTIFADVDPYHPWLSVKDTSYEVLFQATERPLDLETSANLPPDWVSIDRATGEVIEPALQDKDTHFADDAIRTIWRVGLDWEWHKDERAKQYLEKLTFLTDEWKKRKKLSAVYSHNGEVIQDYEANSLYGAVIPYFVVTDRLLAEEFYYSKIAPLYDPDLENFRDDLGYYSQNWVWFGMAYFHGKLINLYDI